MGGMKRERRISGKKAGDAEASFAVELTLLIPAIILVIGAIIGSMFYLYDRTVSETLLNRYIWRTAAENGTGMTEREESRAEEELFEKLSEKCLFLYPEEVQVKGSAAETEIIVRFGRNAPAVFEKLFRSGEGMRKQKSLRLTRQSERVRMSGIISDVAEIGKRTRVEEET